MDTQQQWSINQDKPPGRPWFAVVAVFGALVFIAWSKPTTNQPALISRAEVVVLTGKTFYKDLDTGALHPTKDNPPAGSVWSSVRLQNGEAQARVLERAAKGDVCFPVPQNYQRAMFTSTGDLTGLYKPTWCLVRR